MNIFNNGGEEGGCPITCPLVPAIVLVAFGGPFLMDGHGDFLAREVDDLVVVFGNCALTHLRSKESVKMLIPIKESEVKKGVF